VSDWWESFLEGAWVDVQLAWAAVTDVLRRAGFVSFEAYDTASGEPFGLGADRLTLVATKAA
jgi:hypothetical protein